MAAGIIRPITKIMARIICIDYGGKRTGLAVTDPMQIIATALATIPSKELVSFLQKYMATEPVELILIGCLLYTSPSPRDRQKSRMPSSA